MTEKLFVQSSLDEPKNIAMNLKPRKKHVLQRPCVTHFSHNHPLRPMEAEPKDELICSGCGLDLSGQAYKCSKSNCNFLLHKACLSLEREVKHDSHKQHPLVLLSSPPKDVYFRGVFECNACWDDGTSFVYRCSHCDFDLHVGCALLPKYVKHVDHPNHSLELYYSASVGIGKAFCDVCSKVVPKEQWMYYCAECGYCTHLHCAEEEEEWE